jgi:serine/threonine-protein kinase
MQAALGRTFALSGKRQDALRILEELHKLSEKRYVSPFELASLHYALGQSGEGFEWLTKAFQDRCFELISLRVDPRWQPLKSDPQFHQLFSRLGLP